MKNQFLSIKKDGVLETIIEKSRFICTVKRVENEDDAKNFVLSIKKKYPDATHNCYAYVADADGVYARFSDDGEPQGTAGLPMLDALKNKGVFCTAVVVTRYFGGVKLGTGGLVRAYQGSVIKAINEIGVASNVYSATFKTEVAYNVLPLILKLIEGKKWIKNDVEYLNNSVAITFSAPIEESDGIFDKIRDYSSGKSTVLKIKEGYLEY